MTTALTFSQFQNQVFALNPQLNNPDRLSTGQSVNFRTYDRYRFDRTLQWMAQDVADIVRIEAKITQIKKEAQKLGAMDLVKRIEQGNEKLGLGNTLVAAGDALHKFTKGTRVVLGDYGQTVAQGERVGNYLAGDIARKLKTLGVVTDFISLAFEANTLGDSAGRGDIPGIVESGAKITGTAAGICVFPIGVSMAVGTTVIEGAEAYSTHANKSDTKDQLNHTYNTLFNLLMIKRRSLELNTKDLQQSETSPEY